MRKSFVPSTILPVLIFVLGCSVDSGHTRLSTAPNVSPKPNDAKIDVYHSEKDVDRSYKKLCTVQGYSGTNEFIGYTHDRLIKKALKPEARKCGADAIIIQKRERTGFKHAGSNEQLNITGLAIMYTEDDKNKSN